ncbi:anti-sigma E factor [Yersinia pseudotuberculosis]|nr:sigma-E factor regulatory protein RseB [Yersinia pseudotuberculosis]SUP87783.1 anti-sigma E factor [Yersinia pseudotuberculosis]
MKQLWFSVCLMTGSLFMANIASAESTPIAMLQEMGSASKSLNYELSYINVNKQGIDSLRYRHAILDKKSLAQLLRMDGPRTEILQRGNEISYSSPVLNLSRCPVSTLLMLCRLLFSPILKNYPRRITILR